MLEHFSAWITPPIVYIWLIPVLIWVLTWKAMALWKSARNGQIEWFIVLMLVHTLGILDLLYILFFQREGRVNK